MAQSFNQFMQGAPAGTPAFPGFQAPGTPAGYPGPGALPGQPQQAPAPIQAPAQQPAQGFAPPVFAGQPAPGGFAPPQQGYAAPAPGPQQGAQGFAQPAPYQPGAFAGATLMGQRMPDADPGRYLFKVISTEQAQRESGRQWELVVEIMNDGSPSPKGLNTMFTQGCGTPLQLKYTASFMLEVCMAIWKCQSEAEFKQKVPNWPALFDAMQNKNQQIVADFGANPLAGQMFAGMVTLGDARKDKRNGNQPIPGQFYRRVACSPA